jgi:N6-L-threonylcarbamoyladenine synthase
MTQEPNPVFLGIETSCDETAAAIIQGTRVLSHVVHSQNHQASGGVIPQEAARQHLARMPTVIQETFAKAQITPKDLTGIGVTCGPGLVAGLLVGISFAKGLALAAQKPLWPIHHLQAHALVARLDAPDVHFPFLLLLISGGHCLMAYVQDVHHYTLIGQTYDDAAGECLDKIARALGGPFPGGAFIHSLAEHGDPKSIPLPIPLQKDKTMNFSFSGLKTACLMTIDKAKHHWNAPHAVDLPLSWRQDFCASFQHVIAVSLAERLERALASTGLKTCVVAGGVAANLYMRAHLQGACYRHGATLVAPHPALCTDNGLMIAWATYEQYRAGIPAQDGFRARPHWPLDQL